MNEPRKLFTTMLSISKAVKIVDSSSSSSLPKLFFKKKEKEKKERKDKNLETFVEKKFGKYLHAKRRPRGCWRGAEYVYEFARKAFE